MFRLMQKSCAISCGSLVRKERFTAEMFGNYLLNILDLIEYLLNNYHTHRVMLLFNGILWHNLI